MGRRRTPGLIRRGGVWHIDKQVKGFGRLCESTGARKLADVAWPLDTDRIEVLDDLDSPADLEKLAGRRRSGNRRDTNWQRTRDRRIRSHGSAARSRGGRRRQSYFI